MALLVLIGWFRNFILNNSIDSKNLIIGTKKKKNFEFSENIDEEFLNIKKIEKFTKLL